MLKRKEFAEIVTIWIVLIITLSLLQIDKIVPILIFIFIILVVSIFINKLAAGYFEANTEIKIWRIKRYWFNPGMHFKNPIPVGILFPLILALISIIIKFGLELQAYIILPWLAVLEFDVKPTKRRAAKRHGYYSFHEMTEWHIGCIASASIAASLILAIISYLVGFPELSRLAVYFACFNMLPVSNLDGNKIFFGSRIMWTTLAVICLIFLGYAVFLV